MDWNKYYNQASLFISFNENCDTNRESSVTISESTEDSFIDDSKSRDQILGLLIW